MFLFLSISLKAQNTEKVSWLQPSDTLHKGRFYTTAICGGLTYTGVVIGLNQIWYAEFPRSNFHLFDDSGEWEGNDKAGHFLTTYFESAWSFKGALWTGIPRRKAMWLGAGLGMLYQSTVEVLDGFSEKWGFSLYDMAFNTLGAGLFVGQELLWEEQRIILKWSNFPIKYDNIVFENPDGSRAELQQRVDELYGTSLAERLLKDYNGQIVWASFNLKAFSQNENTTLPGWLNVAVGYGAENMFGGFDNEWIDEAGHTFIIPDQILPRYRQFFLSPDIDLSRIKTKSHLLKTLFYLANMIKVPAPAIEVNTQGKFRFWWFR